MQQQQSSHQRRHSKTSLKAVWKQNRNVEQKTLALQTSSHYGLSQTATKTAAIPPPLDSNKKEGARPYHPKRLTQLGKSSKMVGKADRENVRKNRVGEW